jgi:hypothetical protein
MLKHLLNTTAYTSPMLWDGEKPKEPADDDIQLTTLKEDEKEADPEPEPEVVAEPEAEAEAEADPEPEPETPAEVERVQAKMQKRIDKLTAKQATTEAENVELKKLLDTKAKSGEGLTEEEVERRAELRAEEKVREKEFNKACENLANAAGKVSPTFQKDVKAMAKDIGLIPPIMIGVLEDLDNGGAVLAHLAKEDNWEEAEAIYGMSQGKMALALAKLSDKVKPKPKPRSAAPEPLNNLGGASKAITPLSDNMSEAEWIAERERQVAAKRASR